MEVEAFAVAPDVDAGDEALIIGDETERVVAVAARLVGLFVNNASVPIFVVLGIAYIRCR